MACFLKAPAGDTKGCVVFTTPERDNFVRTSPGIRATLERLKRRYLIGLHHNWHDYSFRYDPLFDFSMAGDGDLIEADNAPFARIPLDACNFSPDFFLQPRADGPFWDILYVARAVAFKGIPELFATVRTLYDAGQMYRVLFICPTPKKTELPGINDLREHFEAMFTPKERQLFTLLTLDWDYPFPLDLETLSFFYRNSRIFLHPAPEERRCRTAAYAWASGMPVVANEHVASILSAGFHKPPYLFKYENPSDIADAVTSALQHRETTKSDWSAVSGEFSSIISAEKVDKILGEIAATSGRGIMSPHAIVSRGLDIRLGRHHLLAVGGNRIDYSIEGFCDVLINSSDDVLLRSLHEADPEIALGHYVESISRTVENRFEPAINNTLASEVPNAFSSGRNTRLPPDAQRTELQQSAGGWAFWAASRRWLEAKRKR
jgi:glycosyltransferase involved in cell wall biosynthesis